MSKENKKPISDRGDRLYFYVRTKTRRRTDTFTKGQEKARKRARQETICPTIQKQNFV